MPLLPPMVAKAVGLPVDYSAAKEVAKIQRALFPPFKERGFVMKGRSFNRLLPDGIVQVVCFFTMPVMSSVYGQFAIEIGVFVPEVWDIRQNVARPKTFASLHCELRDRIKPPGVEKNAADEWEALAYPEVITAAREQTVDAAFAFFDRFADRDKMLADLSALGDRRVGFFSGPYPITLAIIEWNRGQTKAACQRLETYLNDSAKRGLCHPSHEKYVRGLIARLSTEVPNGSCEQARSANK